MHPWRRFFQALSEKFWAGVAIWGRHQRWWWVSISALMLAWLSFDVGRIVTRADLVTLGGPTTGTLSINEVIERASETGGGRLIITSPNTARYNDRSGTAWEVPGFGDRISREQLTELKKQGVVLDGDISIDLSPAKTNPRDILLATATDMLFKLAFLSFYGLIAYFLLRSLGGSGGKRYRRLNKDTRPKVKISDVAGHEGPKQEVTEFVEYLRHPERFRKVGARPPRGVLLHGAPGNGKTLLAKAIAGEADAQFIEQSASSFIQIYAGAGAQSVRRLFAEARRQRPCVVFIDEIDAIGGARHATGSHDERVQCLNALLSEMDGFDNNEGVVVIAATNRIEVLDAALIRPGRFDRKVHIPQPSRPDRLAILGVHARALPNVEADLAYWADQTRGFSGADLAGLVNEAAIEAARANREVVTNEDFAAARDRVLLGARDPGRRPHDRDRYIVAVHELGHATVRLHHGQPVEKVSIEPRGRSLGVTIASVEDEERLLYERADIDRELQVLMGGRAAEEVLIGAVTGGSEDDIARASELARSAIQRFGFGARGPYAPQHESLIHENELAAAKWVSAAYEQAKNIVEGKRAAIEDLVPSLLTSDELPSRDLASLRP